MVDDVSWILADSDLFPGSLVLELTEGALLCESDGSAGRLALLRQYRVRIDLDAFGTGYSSLSYLDRVSVDILKVDRSFVARVGDHNGAALAETVIRLSQMLRLDTVAEGIERQEQLAEMRRLGCRLGQGFLFAKPAEPELVEVMLCWPAPAG